MKIKRTIKIISKKIIKSFKRVLIFFLPRKIIDYLKRVEKAIILALKKLIYLTANSFRNLTWKKTQYYLMEMNTFLTHLQYQTKNLSS